MRDPHQPGVCGERPGAVRPGRYAVLVAGCLAVAGCGGPSAVEVSGEITFDGKPLPAGRIYFNPDVTKGNDGPQGYAEIRDGKYDTRNGGRGAWGGPTIAVIQGYDGSKGPTPGWLGNRLFREYQEAIDLPKEPCTRNFTVPASAASDLPKAPRGGRTP
jgi:hypothetical protein